jgi:FAD/FMN-containing dehydrogenase
MPMRDFLESLRATALTADQITDPVIAQNQTQANSFWAIRERLVESHAITGYPMRSDVSVTLGTIP